MPEYSKEEWQRLIEQYNNDLMAQYATGTQNVSSTQEERTPEEPFTASEANEETDPTPSEPSIPTSPVTNEDPPMSQTDSELTDIGSLQVRVSTENQAIPIVGAGVTITSVKNGNVELERTMVTDQSGLTPIIDLPTKDRSLSLVPGNPTPYATYTVDVTADGYFPKRFVNLPIYGGVTAIQSVSMIPLPESGGEDIVLSYPQSGPAML